MKWETEFATSSSLENREISACCDIVIIFIQSYVNP
jgi:hypothetical protein